MKIALVQSSSIKGDISQNIQNHLNLIHIAIQAKADLIIFPELSITGYEPKLAEDLASAINDSRFNPFQELANNKEVSIGIGMPTKSPEGINISMIIFQPKKERLLYSKKMLHEDEFPYFVSGKHQPFLNQGGQKIALGICYETLQREHFIHAVENNADIYIASVAKPDRGVAKAYLHFPGIAKEFNMPILMSNCVGYCDNFMSNGKSSVWNKKGELLAQLDEENQGLLIYDTALEEAKVLQDEALIDSVEA